MKSILLSFCLVLVGISYGQPFNNFHIVQSMCPEPQTIVYTYENYLIGSHGHGYKIYRNGSVIVNEYDDFYPCECNGIFFINDSVGFYILRFNMGIRLRRTIDFGATWMDVITEAPPFLLGFYIVNEHKGYLMSQMNDYWFFVNTFSGDEGYTIFQGHTPLNDTILTDTVPGITLCPDNSLDFWMTASNDTIDFNINFIIDTTVSIEHDFASNEINIFPNPTEEILQISFNRLEGIRGKIKIFDIYGRMLYCENYMFSAKSSINISQFKQGIYTAVIEYNGKSTARKFVKN